MQRIFDPHQYGSRPIPVFQTTDEAFAEGFEAFILKLERDHRPHLEQGICKIILPPGWQPRRDRDWLTPCSTISFAPKEERITKVSQGAFKRTQQNYKGGRKTVMEYCNYTDELPKSRPSQPVRMEELDLQALDKEIWRELERKSSSRTDLRIYGQDVDASLFDEHVPLFNFRNLETLLTRSDCNFTGLTSPFLYFGMWLTTAPWHREDMRTYSASYCHFGAPKMWYAVPEQSSCDLEQLLRDTFTKANENDCKDPIHHKEYLVSPELLESHEIPYGAVLHEPGTLIVTFPNGYHQVVNLGFNGAEAVNFATPRWLPYGKRSTRETDCFCPHRIATVFNMQFYSDWVQAHPEHYSFITRTSPPPDVPSISAASIQLPTAGRENVLETPFQPPPQYKTKREKRDEQRTCKTTWRANLSPEHRARLDQKRDYDQRLENREKRKSDAYREKNNSAQQNYKNNPKPPPRWGGDE